jgi:hypothetical protein
MVRVLRPSQVIKLDELTPPVLTKIDVQGFEASVVRGLNDLLPVIDFILCELSFRELYAGQPLAAELILRFAQQGFYLSSVSNVTNDTSGLPLQADFLFTSNRFKPGFP